jgi:arylsulfate sulfotransferase
MAARKSRCVVVVFVFVLSIEVFGGCASSQNGNSVVQITPTAAVLAPGQALQFNAVTNVSSVPGFLWEVNGVVGGSPSTGTISTSGMYTAPTTAPSSPIQIGIRRQNASASVSIFNSAHPAAGAVATTQNPLVANYEISIPVGASFYVQFGTDTTYGLTTSAVPAPTSGGAATQLVAGMLANTTYHMQALMQLADGSTATDADHTFTTGTIPADVLPSLTTQLTPGATPNSGIELLSLIPNPTPNLLNAVATDLAGNVIWYYALPSGVYPEPVKLLPNGHMLIVTLGTVNDLREVDLAGNIINQVTSDQISAGLASIPEFQNSLYQGISHDALVLPNGDYLLLASIQQTTSGVTGVPDGTPVLGNVLMDWSLQKGPVWTWSTFDHIDLTYAPNGLADWTHGNALVYSPDDGDIIFSMRNLNWVVKINYNDGAGDGTIVWRLGNTGDFSMSAQQAPMDWNYGQHYPSFLSPNTAGVITVMVFDNGNGRLVDANNDICGTAGVAACYSTVPIYQLDESQKTAAVVWQNILTPAFSFCCGDAQELANGNIEYDIADNVNTPSVSTIQEVTQVQSPELVWQMQVNGQLAYRGMRIPSLYPGQTWPAYAQQNVKKAPTGH